MIIVRLSGGLGNQMFQYALGRKMSLQNRDTFKLDLSVYTPKNNRFFELSSLNIIENLANSAEIKRIRFPYGPLSKISEVIKKKVFRIFNIGFNPNILSRKGNMYLDGFWQSPKYFSDIAHTIKQDFRLRKGLNHAAEIFLNKIKSQKLSVSVHIRRGDYIQDKKTNRHHGTCDEKYYEKAISALSRILGENHAQKIHIFVFSDDIKWVEKNISFPYPATFVNNQNISNPEAMHLMSECHHNIIANSTFSWWAAWLNQNKGKIVIAPSKWNLAHPHEYKDIIPKEWIQI